MADLTMPLILASQSQSRRAMLTAAGVAFEAIPAHIDERTLEAALGGADTAIIALALAEAKALAVSSAAPGRLVLGSDSLVVCNGRRFDKPATMEDAAEHLRAFSGRVMGRLCGVTPPSPGCMFVNYQSISSPNTSPPNGQRSVLASAYSA